MSFDQKIRWISASIDSRQLTELKCRFKNDINSKRKYSQVYTFFDLVGVLLSRGIVSHEDVTVLNEICQEYFRINFSDIPDSLSSARPSVIPGSDHVSHTAAAQTTQSSGLTNGNHGSGKNSSDKDLKTIPPEVIDVIVSGNINEKQWRPFARALQVDTESISHERSNSDKVQKALSTFMQTTEQHKQWTLLEVALEKIRRMDLRERCRALLTSQES